MIESLADKDFRDQNLPKEVSENIDALLAGTGDKDKALEAVARGKKGAKEYHSMREQEIDCAARMTFMQNMAELPDKDGLLSRRHSEVEAKTKANFLKNLQNIANTRSEIINQAALTGDMKYVDENLKTFFTDLDQSTKQGMDTIAHYIDNDAVDKQVKDTALEEFTGANNIINNAIPAPQRAPSKPLHPNANLAELLDSNNRPNPYEEDRKNLDNQAVAAEAKLERLNNRRKAWSEFKDGIRKKFDGFFNKNPVQSQTRDM